MPRILIADDCEADRELLTSYLAMLDCQIELAVDGQDALTRARSFHPDLILLDVVMPKLSGFEVCKQLKSHPATRKAMVLVVSAINEMNDIERAVAAGTDDFLAKPVNKRELIPRIQNLLKIKEIGDQRDR